MSTKLHDLTRSSKKELDREGHDAAQRYSSCQKFLPEWFMLRKGGRRSPERRFDGLASLEVKGTSYHPAKNQSDKTFGNQYNVTQAPFLDKPATAEIHLDR